MTTDFRNWFICFHVKWIIYQWLHTTVVFEGILHTFKRSFYLSLQLGNKTSSNKQFGKKIFLKAMDNFFNIKIQCLHFMNHFVLRFQCTFSTSFFTCEIVWTAIKCSCDVNNISGDITVENNRMENSWNHTFSFLTEPQFCLDIYCISNFRESSYLPVEYEHRISLGYSLCST